MHKSEYLNIKQNEDVHFFYRGLADLICRFANRYFPSRRPLVILDAGCGTGAISKHLLQFGDIHGVDFAEDAVQIAASNGIRAVYGDICALPFADNFFDGVICTDVLYHKAVDPQKAVQELHRVLKPGGILLLRVPAFDFLYTAHDVHVHTARRFSTRSIRALLRLVDFEVIRLSYVSLWLFPLSLLMSIAYRISGKVDDTSSVRVLSPLLNLIFLKLQRGENRMLEYVNLPVGQGVIAVSRKNTNNS